MNDSINPFLLYEGTLLRLVPHEPDNGYRFYVSCDGTIGLRISPTGVESLASVRTDSTPNCIVQYNANRKQRYLKFCNAWGYHKDIYVAHAVYLAWVEPIPEGLTVDHIDGNTLNNDFRNLRVLPREINSRDGGFLKKLRNKGIDPTMFATHVLLRYIKRMAEFKSSHTRWQYDHLTREELLQLLLGPDFTLVDPTIFAAEEPDKYI